MGKKIDPEKATNKCFTFKLREPLREVCSIYKVLMNTKFMYECQTTMEGSRRGAVVLIIGATGYTGQFVVKHFLEEQDKEPSSTRFTIHATYHLAAPSSRATIDSRIHWHCVDFASDAIKEHARQLVTTCKPDVIINVAALSSAPQCQKNPALAWKVNCVRCILFYLYTHIWMLIRYVIILLSSNAAERALGSHRGSSLAAVLGACIYRYCVRYGYGGFR